MNHFLYLFRPFLFITRVTYYFRRVLVDSGEAKTGEAYTKLLSNVLREENATIEHVLITHWHHDHIGGVESVRSLLKKLSPGGERPIVWKLPRASHDERSNDEASIQWQPLRDEQVVEVEGAKLQVKYTPGHTTDHACLLLQDDDVLFSGDCILGEGTTVFEDLHEYMLSLEKILKMRPKIIYPGHGPVLEDPLPRIEYYIQHRQQREAEILQVVEQQEDNKPITDVEIVKKIYKVRSISGIPVLLQLILTHFEVKAERMVCLGHFRESAVSRDVHRKAPSY